jgi:molecular chaperone DnaJ
MNTEYYELLEVSQSADKKEIKKAFKRLAKQHHPDKNTNNPNAEEEFKKINEAYQVLSDDQKRATYDRFGKEGLQGGSRGGGGGFTSSDFFDDVFSDFFGGSSSRSAKREPQAKYNQDLEIAVQLSFQEAVFGVKKEINYTFKTACEPCNATGADKGQLVSCSSCGGSGQMHIRQGFMTLSQTCSTCRGAGTMPGKSCSSCRGAGYKQSSEKLSLNIPEGVDNGNRIRVGGKGNIMPRNQRGDLYLHIEAREDEHFVRDGNDIYLEVSIFFTNILLSKIIKVPSIRGEVELNLHPKIKDKEHIVFRNGGVKDVNSHQKGNFITQIKILYPSSINKEQKNLLEELHSSFSVSGMNESSMSSIIDKMKSWFS